MPTRSINLTDAEQQAILSGGLPPSVVKKVQTAVKPRSRRSHKQKGLNFQKIVCDKLAEYLKIQWDNQDDDSPIASRPSGQHGEDIILRGEAKKRLPFSFEVKNVESLSISDAVQQSKTNAGDKKWVIVHRKKAFQEDVVYISFDTFLWLLDKGGF